jgi:hypothetical protein
LRVTSASKEDLYPEARLKFHNVSGELNLLVKCANELGLKAKEILLFKDKKAFMADMKYI